MKKRVLTKTFSTVIKLVLLALILLPIILFMTGYENKLILVTLFLFAFSCIVGIFVVDDYTIKKDDSQE